MMKALRKRNLARTPCITSAKNISNESCRKKKEIFFLYSIFFRKSCGLRSN
jgi:hypothetical protein